MGLCLFCQIVGSSWAGWKGEPQTCLGLSLGSASHLGPLHTLPDSGYRPHDTCVTGVKSVQAGVLTGQL